MQNNLENLEKGNHLNKQFGKFRNIICKRGNYLQKPDFENNGRKGINLQIQHLNQFSI